ncbi:MAG TPA: hypothetical protein VJ507_02350 [Candidatus Bathyarchaeia archaeon]|nr:hypothetical protein [Candidatus Bathyarchaeia archaeon]
MKKEMITAALLICALASVAVYSTSAQVAVVLGVAVGDNFTYSFEVFWSSTNSSKAIPEEFLQLNQTESIHVTVTNVDATLASVNITRTGADGSTSDSDGVIDVSSGQGIDAFGLIIGGNLTQGDTAYPFGSSFGYSFKIGETVRRTYLNVEREVNHYEANITNAPNYVYVYNNVFFDKKTGVMLEWFIERVGTDTRSDKDSVRWMITQFDVSGPPSDGNTPPTGSFSPWILPAIVVVVVVVAVLAVVFVFKRRRKGRLNKPT